MKVGWSVGFSSWFHGDVGDVVTSVICVSRFLQRSPGARQYQTYHSQCSDSETTRGGLVPSLFKKSPCTMWRFCFFFLSWVKQHLRGTTLKDEDLTNHGNENREIGSCLPDGLQWSYLTLDSPHREDAVDRWSWKLFQQVRTVKNTSFNALAAFGMFSAETVYYDQL